MLLELKEHAFVCCVVENSLVLFQYLCILFKLTLSWNESERFDL
jgi:hypothetical protein